MPFDSFSENCHKTAFISSGIRHFFTLPHHREKQTDVISDKTNFKLLTQITSKEERNFCSWLSEINIFPKKRFFSKNYKSQVHEPWKFYFFLWSSFRLSKNIRLLLINEINKKARVFGVDIKKLLNHGKKSN